MTVPALVPAPEPRPEPGPDSRAGGPDQPAPARGEVGYGRPPASGRFRPGQSGNPHGRPRRPRAPTAPVPAERTELERALARQVDCHIDGVPRRVSLIRMVVSRLSERALLGDVVACRELARLWCEAETLRAAREAEAARRAAEEAAAAEAAEAEARAAARAELARRAWIAALRADEDGMEDRDRALKVLDAADVEDDRPVALHPWIVDAARAHDPRAPLDVDLRPHDPDDIGHSLVRLGVGVTDDRGEAALAGWFVDAARERLARMGGGCTGLSGGDEALLQLVRVDGRDEPDWRARLAGPGSDAAPSLGAAARPAP